MKKSDLYAIEGIDQQLNSPLGFEIEQEIIKIIADTTSNGSFSKYTLKNSKLTSIIKKYTGLTINFELYDIDSTNAYSCVEMPDDIWKAFTDNKYMEGTINLKAGILSGVFSKFNLEIGLGREYLYKDSMFTPAETTASILHEIGHVFVYFEMLCRYTKTNHILIEGTQRLLTANTKEQRFVILKDIENEIGVSIPDKEKITAKARTEDAYKVIILYAASEASKQQLDVDIYDCRSIEQLADLFASRHGYGRALATSLDKTYTMYGHKTYNSPAFNTFMNVVTALLKIGYAGMAVGMTASPFFVPAISPVVPIIGATLLSFTLLSVLFLNNPLVVNYDPPAKRILKLKQQINNALKDRTLTKEKKKIFVSDYYDIERILDKMHENIGLTEYLYQTFLPSGRKQSANIRMHEELENLLNNPLFTATAELELINK